ADSRLSKRAFRMISLSLPREHHVSQGFAVGILKRLEKGDRQLSVAGALLQQLRQLLDALVLGHAFEQARVHIKRRKAVLGRNHGDSVRLWQPGAVAKDFAWRQEDEGQYDADHDVILPASALEIPKDKPLEHFGASLILPASRLSFRSPGVRSLTVAALI